MIKRPSRTLLARLLLGGMAIGSFRVVAASAAERDERVSETRIGLDALWVTVAAMLAFFMQAGPGVVEAGFIRVKNACNILTKNFLDYCTASVMLFLVGYAPMFGSANGFIGASAGP